MAKISTKLARTATMQVVAELKGMNVGEIHISRFPIRCSSGGGLKRRTAAEAFEIQVDGLSAVIIRSQVGLADRKDGTFMFQGVEIGSMNGNRRKVWSAATRVARTLSIPIQKL